MLSERVEKFLRELGEITGERELQWELNKGLLRCRGKCPVTLKCWIETGTDFPNYRPVLAGVSIGLDFGSVSGIVTAADKEPGHDKELRARLLEACGLKE